LKEYGMDSKRVAPSQVMGGAGQGEAGMRRLALERHPQVVAASLAVAEAEAALRRDGQWPNPGLEGKLVFDMEGRPAGEGALKFAIPLGGRIGAAHDRALVALEMAHLNLDAARKQALAQVERAFAALSLAQARLTLFEQLRQRSAQYADLARSRREASIADSVDVALVLSDAARDRRRVARAKAGVRKARVELLRLCGLRAAAPGKLSVAPPQRQDLAEDFESLRKSALKSSDALGKARLAFRLADRRLALHLAEQWPDLTLGPAIVGDAGGVALGLAVGMEIPMLHQRGGQVEVARLQREAAAEALRQQARDLTARLDASFIELDALKAELDGLLKCRSAIRIRSAGCTASAGRPSGFRQFKTGIPGIAACATHNPHRPGSRGGSPPASEIRGGLTMNSILRTWFLLGACTWILTACDSHHVENQEHHPGTEHVHTGTEHDHAGTEHDHDHTGTEYDDHAGTQHHDPGTEHDHDHTGTEHDDHAGTEHHDPGTEYDDHAGTEHDHAEHEHGDDCLDAEFVKALPGVMLGSVELSAFAPHLKIPGRVRVDPDRRVSVSAPVGARIQTLDAPPRATVTAGRRLAWLQLIDTDVRHQQIKAVEFRAELLAAETERDRTRRYMKALQSKGATVATELSRVRADLGVAEAQVRSRDSALKAVLASLRLAGLSASQLEALAQKGQVVTHIALRAPKLGQGLDLEVAVRSVHAGQTVAPGTQLYELVALDRLQVVGEAFEADLEVVRRAIREKLPVGLLFPATKEHVEGLTIFSMESGLDSVDEGLTRFFLWLPNKVLYEKTQDGHRYLDWRHRAGARVQVLVGLTEPSLRVVLPAGAVVREQGRSFVFRMDDHGHISRLAVGLEQIDDRQAVLKQDADLHAGDTVVLEGALQVQLAIKQNTQPQAPAGHHGHAH